MPELRLNSVSNIAKQFTALSTMVSIVSAGILFSVHVQSDNGCSLCCSKAKSGCSQQPTEIPVVPPSESEGCTVCQFAGNLGGPLATTVIAQAAQRNEVIYLRLTSFDSLLPFLAYQGRAPPFNLCSV